MVRTGLSVQVLAAVYFHAPQKYSEVMAQKTKKRISVGSLRAGKLHLRPSLLKTVILALLIIIILGAIPLPYTYKKTAELPFSTTNQKSVELELGDTKVLEKGSNGSMVVEFQSLQSIWGRLFGLQPVKQKEVATTFPKNATNKVVLEGTKKYQYMICSDGTHRYYTDDEFKDPYTGFTSKSPDYCKMNNHGTRVKLADTADGSVSSQTPRSSSNNTPQYKTQSSGTKALPTVNTSRPTANTQSENDAEAVRQQQELDRKHTERLRNIMNCINSLTAQGMQRSQAQSKCEQWF